MHEAPHITVASVVQQAGRFLMVKEIADGREVYNQPAGHLELGESLVAAAERETLEETGWRVRATAFLGVYQHTSSHNGVCYVRHCFIADPVRREPERELDSAILEAVWMRLDEVKALEADLRNPMVLEVLTDHEQGITYPLDLIKDWPQ
ncbi:MAG TPA: NUDIX hydrolase [Gammaproteobacteria bacterium]|jgi:8-oxo-dGTP pyrophosphatase MutT (NUDIX family)|nr:NUDIX hydrolase [Gammaproteobacteria bacterium]MDP6733393.1 NUDIX hydrolase [Gammaproteobacteria bacterium]HAJ75849.1 NUDIX hydrolase [Gammaproteobacteria bacterium]|tara:strand:- start:501 stop:950 length:450 start_codon:yes stop_codon:yes gene_type:complete